MGALDDLKVLDFTWVFAGPLTTKYLADHSATVIRVESIHSPDIARTMVPYKGGVAGINRGGTYAYRNPNKYGMALNLNHPKARPIVERLVSWADVVAENFTPGTMEKWGLGYDSLKRIKPDLIMVSLSIHGQTGPYARHLGFGIQLAGSAGFTHLTGWPDREPSGPYGAYTDVIAPDLAAAAVLAALDYRRRTGLGQYLDLSQSEASLQYLAPAILDFAANGRVAMPAGNASPCAAPHGTYRCRGDDRWCAISVFDDRQWEGFRTTVSESWTGDPRFASLVRRKENEEELDRLTEVWTVGNTAEEVAAGLQARGVPAGVVENSRDLLEDPQLAERGYFWYMEHAELGRICHMGQPFRLSGTPAEPRMPSPCLGEHTFWICTEVLGMRDDEFSSLASEGMFE